MDLAEIEVETKFLIPSGFEATLNSRNAQLVSDKTFTDIYLDDSQNTLALADTWLRRRDGKLQLKYSPADRVESSVHQYKESEDVNFIRQYVCGVFNKSLAGNDVKSMKTPDKVMDSVRGFAEITTKRKEYKLGDSVIVDLDTTDFGYDVGEIEVMSSDSSSHLHSAVNTVNETVKLLNVQTVSKFEGKLMTYLSMNNPQLLEKIKDSLGT